MEASYFQQQLGNVGKVRRKCLRSASVALFLGSIDFASSSLVPIVANHFDSLTGTLRVLPSEDGQLLYSLETLEYHPLPEELLEFNQAHPLLLSAIQSLGCWRRTLSYSHLMLMIDWPSFYYNFAQNVYIIKVI